MRGKGLFGLHFMPQLMSEGNQGRNLNVEAGTEAQRNTAYELAQLAFFFLIILKFFISYIMCVHLCVGICMSAVPEEAKSIAPFALEVNINGLMWVLRIELKCSMQEQCVLLIDKLHLQPSACLLMQSRPNCLRIASSTVGRAFCINKKSRPVPQTSPQGSLTGATFQPKFPLFRRL